MLRRAAVVLRVGLFVLGVAAMAALVLDSFLDFALETTWPRDRAFALVDFGAIQLICEDVPGRAPNYWTSAKLTLHEVYLWFPLPKYQHSVAPGRERWNVRIPLWLLGTVCLAWPVTSFLVARRRSRGFEVGVRAAGSTPLPPREVDAERSGAERTERADIQKDQGGGMTDEG